MNSIEFKAKAIIFDLDGTLLDTLDDLCDAANTVLARRGLPAHARDEYRFFVGDGMETLMQRAAPPDTDAAALQVLCEDMRGEYGRGWARKTAPYRGIVEMLQVLQKRGVPLEVLSNKPHEYAVLTVEHFFPGIGFVHIQGSPPGAKAKPDPALALALARKLGFAPGEVLFMGDSRVDMDTAVAAGMIPTGALWGFRPESELVAHGAKLLLAKPEDVFAYV